MMRAIPTYEDKAGNIIQFRTIHNIPGFSYRVVRNGLAVDWLRNDQRPSAKVAAYYAEKHNSGPAGAD